ncbi:ABC transporter permease [Deinococcus metallilatus]|uniref:ABC transporter permease n=1 Tax=Deinococcus metallilatus TaxID=1211322 RepID=A0AAJ5F7U3_9DEIO|nr:ABC transporter permease [Deinococcus metallilatus]MBB5295982.1 sodium transport system permease protein [Deinococcus metallilatus]QBY08195.1 ABC transporter permease [Deinococcus metallilatus]RXJ11926.1 ABC transporter permease [Deinococcus metallilatus]TLK25842.1 ABC transporter permease [Deinococcus metallilatus]GMA14483.1 ABC transporter [Deinococcus metallilatus]
MRPDYIWRVASRDLLSTLRDRRTLTSTILIPLLLIPLFTLGLPLLMGKLIGGQAQERQKVGVVGTLPESLRAALTKDEKTPGGTVTRAGVDLVPVKDPKAAVQSGEVDAALRAPSPLPARAGDGTGTLEVYAKLGSLRAQTGAFAKVQSTVEAYNRELAVQRLHTLGLGAQTLTPVTLDPIDASPEQERRSGQLAFLIPLLMLNFILTGAMATALDATAGEKERGTLESLLVSPVRRSEVVAGKLLATTVTALTTACFSVLGFLLSGLIARAALAGAPTELTQAFGGQLTLTLGSALALLGTMVSAALLISAVLIALSIYARSYKEAQTYVTPLSLLIVFPAVLLQFSDFLTLSGGIYALPLFGSMVAILDTVRGNLTVGHVLTAIAANLLGALLVGLLALRSFGREEVIFRN